MGQATAPGYAIYWVHLLQVEVIRDYYYFLGSKVAKKDKIILCSFSPILRHVEAFLTSVSEFHQNSTSDSFFQSL